MMCIDFYSSNDMSLGQFLDKFCFANSKNEFKRAFLTSKLSFSHDTGRVIVRVKDLNEFKDTGDQLPPEGLLHEFSYRSVLQQIRSDEVLMWSRNMGACQTPELLSSEYSVVSRDVWNYSFGKLLEDMFYGKAMGIDCLRFPHLAGVSGSRDASLVHYFSRRGRVVSVHVEPLEPVLHVALQPALWQDHVDHQVQIDAIHDLCNLLESNPPQDVFAYNAHFRETYEHAVEWSLRITRAVQTTVKPTMAVPINSPRSALPRSWFDPIPSRTESSDRSSEPPTPSVLESSTPVNLTFQEPGNLAHLASFARSLAVSSSPGGMAQVANEVTNTLRLHGGSQHSEPWDTDEGYDRYDESSHSIPADFMVETEPPPNGGPVLGRAASAMGVFGHIASTMGALASKKALENFRLTQQAKKTDILGYLTLPKRLLEWHPSLPLGANKDTVLVNARQPTSVVAYSLFSKEYSQCISDNMRKEATRHALDGNPAENGAQVPVNNCTQSDATATMLRILRSTTRNNVDHSFVDDNQFQPAMRFSCKSYYAMQFHALRKLYYGGDRNYVESLCNCQQWNAAGGKSGAGFLKTRDERFIAKAIPEIELQMFLSMANEYFCYMAKTFENDLSSMLSKVLGIYKVSISNTTHNGDNDSNVRMCVIVMENLMYGREVDFTFDLKGKMEGRYKEDVNGENSTVLWDRNFVELAGGIPLPLQESALSLLLSAIMNDTSFLSTVQATDYSMLVGYDVKKQELVACIIDYIHKYDFMKMMEHASKRLIQEEGEITVLNPKHYRRRFCLAMSKYFVTIPSRYTKVTTVVRNTASNTTTGSVGTSAQDDERDYNLPPMSTSTSTTASTATIGSVSTIPGSLVSTQRR
ncbi:hypothetical protein BBJ29_004754 [Phytophthora kernoviae]|uniref:PIPK domain-containing protein n=1 Tax=Phytophthora kernoviae TaxID=325452 RepID=A0A3F2RYT7_9STRA|nr:hypothetical protein BBJ29_004754 [Phytophthora kernoviae]RLN66844.1 hypothetical protein BBP00_00002007 [Phytophthora kernoviae]